MEGLFEARYNTYWYLSFFLPLIIMIGSAYFGKKSIFIVGIVLSLLGTFYICELSIFEKWKASEAVAIANNDIQDYEAVGEEERKTRAFFIASIESLLYTAIWSVVGWQLWPLLRRGHLSEKATPST